MSDRRWLRRLAVVLAVLAVMTLVSVPIVSAWLHTAAEEDDGLLGLVWLGSWLGFPIVGGVLAARRPENPLGWIMVVVTLTLGLTILCDDVARYHTVVGPLPLGDAAVWFSFLSASPPFLLVPFLILLFPSGRIESSRWRRAAAGAAGLGGSLVLAFAVRPASDFSGVELVNPLGVPSLGGPIEAVIPVLAVSLTVFAMAVVFDAVRRFRRSRGVERQQFRWFAHAAVIFPIGMGTTIAFDHILPPVAVTAMVALSFFLSFNGMAIAIGIAVTRHRLYDIDRVVSRSLAYAILTLLLVATYATGAIGVGALLPGERSDLLVAASTLVVAALFGPLRGRIQRVVDRRFNRASYDAAAFTEQFARRLRDRVDLDDVAFAMRAAVGDALQPALVGLWLPPARR